MKKVLSLTILFLTIGLTSIQAAKSGYAYFASGGKFGADKFVKFYQQKRSNNSVRVFDSLPGSFTNSACYDERTHLLFISAEKRVAVYNDKNPDTLKRIDTISIPGVSILKTNKNWLIAGKGFGSINGNLSFFSLDSFKEFIPKTTPSSSVSDMTILGDSLYVAFGGGYVTPDSTFISTYYLGGSKPLFVKTTFIGSYLYGVGKISVLPSNKGFFATTSGYATRTYTINISYSGKIDTSYVSGLGTGGYVSMDGKNLFMPYNNSFATIGTSNPGTVQILTNYNASLIDFHPLDQEFYLVKSDFSTKDKVIITDVNGKKLDSFIVGVSTQAMAINPNNKTGIEEISPIENLINVYPNPANNILNIESKENSMIHIFDCYGRVVSTYKLQIGINQIPVNQLQAGIYFIQSGVRRTSFIKN